MDIILYGYPYKLYGYLKVCTGDLPPAQPPTSVFFRNRIRNFLEISHLMTRLTTIVI